MKQRAYNAAAGIFGECVSLSTTPAERAASLASQGIVLNRAGRNAEAKPVLEQALTANPETQSGADRAVISAVLASVYRILGDYQRSERTLRAAIADPSAGSGARAGLMVNLADLLREESREIEASAVLDEATRLPGVPRAPLINVLVERAEVAREMHLWETSVTDWNKVGEIASAEHSSQLEEVYTGGLGETWFAAGDIARAEPLLRRSLQLLRNDSDSSGSQIAMALALMARLYVAEGKLALAADALDEAMTKDEACIGKDHPQVAMLLELRASILSRRGEVQAARDDLERARNIMSSHFGPESAAVAGVAAVMGDVEQAAHQPAAAAADYGIAMRLLRAGGADGLCAGSALMVRYSAALKAAHLPGDASAFMATAK